MILAQTTAPKVFEWASYGNYRKVTQNPHFLENAKGGPREIFKKSPKKQPSFERPKSTLAQMALFSNLYALKLQRLEKMLRQTRGAKSARMAKLWQFMQGHPKPAFSEKVQRGDQGKFFKNCSKGSPRLKHPYAVSRKWDYPLISTHLTCKEWK